jgi:hypothetical protein
VLQRPKVEHLQSLSLLEGGVERILPNLLSQIQCVLATVVTGIAFHRDPIVGVRFSNQVDSDAGPTTVIAPPSCHVDQAAIVRPDSPQCGGTSVAENGITAARQNRRHQPAVSREICMVDCIHASVQAMQPPRAQAVLNAEPAESQPRELLMCHETVLPIRNLSDLSVARSNFWAYVAHFFDLAAHGRTIASPHAQDYTRVQKKRCSSAGCGGCAASR